MSTPFLGEIKVFACNFAPKGWALCNGQIVSIQQNQALFALLGTTYGGNGTTTFALPNLQGRVPLHFGSGAGLSVYNLGQTGGTESVTLAVNQIPSHNHSVACNTSTASQPNPAGNFPGTPFSNTAGIYETSANGTMAANAIANNGGSQPHENRQPGLVLNYCIALQGIFPSRS
jgi:microcystin-dependent protein